MRTDLNSTQFLAMLVFLLVALEHELMEEFDAWEAASDADWLKTEAILQS
jgi:hypothetical protein